MADDQIRLMDKLGFQEFRVIGHNRGARTAHRMCLDFPTKVKKVAINNTVWMIDSQKCTSHDQNVIEF